MKTLVVIIILAVLGVGIYDYIETGNAEREINILYLDTRQAHLFDLDYATAQKGYHRLVEAKYPLAFYELARMYEKGEGVAMDFNRATSLYQQGLPLLREQSNAGDDVASYYLGEMYRFGRGVAKDKTKAIDYFQRVNQTDLRPEAQKQIRAIRG